MVAQWLITCLVVDLAVIIANVIEQILIARKWEHLDRIDHLLLSLSIADLVSGLATGGVDSWYLAEHYGAFPGSDVYQHRVIAKVFDMVFLFSVFASIFHIVAVAIERLYAIRFPRKYYIFTTSKFKRATIAVVWIAPIAITPAFMTVTSLSNSSTGVIIRAVVLAASASLVFVTYLIIAYFLLKQRKTIVQDFSPDCGIQEERLKRLTVLCLFIGISFVICILPITLTYIDARLYHPFSNIMVTLNSFVNPCVYFVKVYYESRSITRSRSSTTHALLDTRSYAHTFTTESNEDGTDLNDNDSDKA